MDRRHYFILLKAGSAVTALRNIPQQISKVCAEQVKLVWQTDATLIFAATTTRRARDILEACLEGLKAAKVRDIAIFEIGTDWVARTETNLDGWLTSHLRYPQKDIASERFAKESEENQASDQPD